MMDNVEGAWDESWEGFEGCDDGMWGDSQWQYQAFMQQQMMQPRANAERLNVYKGLVKALNEKGYCFVACPAVKLKFHRDVYFDSEEIQRGELVEGKEISFIVHLNERNQPMGKVVPPNGVFTGFLKNYEDGKGFGFLECPDARRLFENDVWVHHKSIEAAGISCGDEMQFFVQLNNKNQPQAVQVKRYQGIVKKRARFTFVENAEVKKTYGKDAFVVEGETLPAGTSVIFLLTFNDSMEPQAEEISICGDATDVNALNEARNAIAEIAKNSPDTVYEGVVKSTGANYGFVESEEIKRIFGKDVFTPINFFHEEGTSVGDAVYFTMHINEQGNPQALKIKKRANVDSSEDDPMWKKQRHE